MTQTTAQEVLKIVHDAGMIRARDLAARGISPTHLQRLYEKGLLVRVIARQNPTLLQFIPYSFASFVPAWRPSTSRIWVGFIKVTPGQSSPPSFGPAQHHIRHGALPDCTLPDNTALALLLLH